VPEALKPGPEAGEVNRVVFLEAEQHPDEPLVSGAAAGHGQLSQPQAPRTENLSRFRAAAGIVGQHLASFSVTAFDQGGNVGPVEIQAPERVYVWPDVPVARADRLRRLAEEEAEELIGEHKRGGQVERVRQVFGGVGNDGAAGTLPACHAHRDVGHEGPVAEVAAIQLFRFEDQGDRHAGPDRSGEVAGPEDDLLAPGEVGRDGPEGDGERVEPAAGQEVPPQQGGIEQRVDLVFTDGGTLQGEPAVALLPHDERRPLAERAGGAGLVLPEEIGEVEGAGQRVYLATGVAAGVHGSHDGTHAGPDHEIGPDPEAVEDPEDADVG